MNTATQNQKSEMKNYLYFAGTIYDSFEALEEVLGKLKLERPLFLLYAAKKAYAEEVFAAAGEKPEKYNPAVKPLFKTSRERYEYLMEHGCTCNEDRIWLKTYKESKEYIEYETDFC